MVVSPRGLAGKKVENMGDLAERLMEELECRTPFTIPIFGGIPVPESCVMTWIIMAALVIGSIIFTKTMKLVPTGAQCIIEGFILWMDKFFLEILGEKGRKYLPVLETLLLYIGISNTIGLIGLRPPTKDLGVTATLAIFAILLIQFSGIRERGVKGWLKSFTQPMVIMLPINILELVIKPLSLCMRLFGNVLGAFVIMELLKLIVPVGLPLVFSFYFDVFDGCIQAYVFVFLTSLFMSEAMEEE
ncbi:F0F1 ATP synthase subunit A [uncultured Ruminococcus sp.]|uniref:F0F1 ATP synthase subunit A n=1 Tax=uncultured Ruminococcus sp. TaxID=165186 RepID=UPI00262E0074|nr:F0F1 ATP synthase subunit A [uncultured Ruminococcus sp.]